MRDNAREREQHKEREHISGCLISLINLFALLRMQYMHTQPHLSHITQTSYSPAMAYIHASLSLLLHLLHFTGMAF